MNRTIGILAGLMLSAGSLFVGANGQESTEAQEAISIQLGARSGKGFRAVGAVSCGASICHGKNDIGQPGSEFLIWNSRDPHARSFQGANVR